MDQRRRRRDRQHLRERGAAGAPASIRRARRASLTRRRGRTPARRRSSACSPSRSPRGARASATIATRRGGKGDFVRCSPSTAAAASPASAAARASSRRTPSTAGPRSVRATAKGKGASPSSTPRRRDEQLAEMRAARARRARRTGPASTACSSADGEVVYVGKSKRVRTRLLSYFRCALPRRRARASCARRRASSGSTRRASSPRCSRSCA